MQQIRPAIVIGVGPQARRTVHAYVRCVQDHGASTQSILPIVLEYAVPEPAFGTKEKDVQYLSLSPPLFENKADWPHWLPLDLAQIPSAQVEQSRAWMRAALFQGADVLQDFLVESIPRLSSFSAVEAMRANGLALARNSQVEVYVIADLSDSLGSGIAVDLSCFASFVCRQLGLTSLSYGVLCLPSATSPAPIEEATAYAALKEIDYYARGNPYQGDLPEPELMRDLRPFVDGCYLMDSVNEAGYTLPDEGQQAQIVAEWMYAMTFSGIADAVRERRDRRYQTATYMGKARSFESVGLALRSIPEKPLSIWVAARLGQQIIERLLYGSTEDDTPKRLLAFVEHLGLRLDVMESLLRRTDDDVEHVLGQIRHASLGRVEVRAREVLQEIRQQYLPELEESIRATGAKMVQEARQAVSQEVDFTLQDTAAGGIVSSYRFLDMLSENVQELNQEIDDQTQQQRIALGQSLSTVSETYYALRKATMSVPPWPVAVLAVMALLVFPLIYGAQWIWRMLHPLGSGWAVGALVLLGLGMLAVLLWTAIRLAASRRHAIDMHVRLTRERFELESKPLVFRAVKGLCAAIQEAIEDNRKDLDDLCEKLGIASQHMREREQDQAQALEDQARPDPRCSVVTLKRAERFYRRVVQDINPLVKELLAQAGHLAEWQARVLRDGHLSVGWLDDQISRYGVQYARERLRGYSVVDALSDGASPDEIAHSLEGMAEYTFPLWNINPRLIRRGKTQRITLAALNTTGAGWEAVEPRLAEVWPKLSAIPVADPHVLAIVTMHRGVPLFALRRIGEYRAHYAQMLWNSRLPVHGARSLCLIQDLVPLYRRPRLPPAALFAVGLALGMVTRAPDGRHVAPRPKGRTLRLSAQKERSVALLGMDGPASRELWRRLVDWKKEQTPLSARQAMDDYMDNAPDLEDWEVTGILDFVRTLEAE